MFVSFWSDPVYLALLVAIVGFAVVSLMLYWDLLKLRRFLLEGTTGSFPRSREAEYYTVQEQEEPRIGEYSVVEPIAAGGYAWVFKVRDRRNRLWVAKVFMPREAGTEPEWPPAPSVVNVLDRIIGDYDENRRLHDMIRRFFSEVRVLQTVREIVSDDMWWRTILSSSQCRDREEVCEELRRYIRNIINVYDVNRDLVYFLRAGAGATYYSSAEKYVEDPPYVIIEYAEKGSVENIRDTLLSNPRHLLRFFEKVAGAVALYYISYGGVHCDIKPGNVLVSEVGGEYEPIVTDFGIARRVGEVVSMWNPGTPQFMPPEYLLYPTGSVWPTWDVYSLAATMYSIITGRIPFVQHVYIAVSRHPGIPGELKKQSRRIVESLEATIFGISMLVVNRVEDLVYRGIDLSKPVDAEVALLRMSRLSHELREGALKNFLSRDVGVLESSAEKLGLPWQLVTTVVRSLDPDPSRRPRDMVEMWLELRDAGRFLG